jgi:Ran GTPase-activating protein (RanGAP) involved in mRNA processing and transport
VQYHLHLIKSSISPASASDTIIFLNRKLDLSWNKLGQTSAAHLGQAISVTRYLKELNLAYNGIGDLGAEMIGGALFENSR